MILKILSYDENDEEFRCLDEGLFRCSVSVCSAFSPQEIEDLKRVKDELVGRKIQLADDCGIYNPVYLPGATDMKFL